MGISSRLKNKAIFFDRDGVINESVVHAGKPYPPSSVASLVIAPCVAQALKLLKSHGYKMIVVTNQPDVARGKTSQTTVEAINHYLQRELPELDEFKVCFHDDTDNCTCRKPKPGLLLQAEAEYGLDLCQSFMVGDRWKDISAGQAAGCTTIWLNRHYQEREPQQYDYTTDNLLDAAKWIINRGVQHDTA